jgi:hypothetical protein
MMIIRDHGHWAGFMMGVYAYLLWVRKPKLIYALYWQVGFLFGALFRPECLFFNIILPFTYQFFLAEFFKLKYFFHSICIPFIIFLILIFISVLTDINALLFESTRLSEIYLKPIILIRSLFLPFELNTDNYFLQILINDYSLGLKYIFLSYVAVYKWIAGLGILNLFLFIYALKNKLVSLKYTKVLFMFLLISSLITILHLFFSYVLSSRYWVMNWWIVYLFCSLGLHHLWHFLSKSNNYFNKYMKFILIFLFFLFIASVVYDKPKENYEQNVGNWIKLNHLNLEDVYFNDRRIAYYSGLIEHHILDKKIAINSAQYEYIVIKYTKSERIEEQIPKYRPIKYFPSLNDPRIVIFRKKDD